MKHLSFVWRLFIPSSFLNDLSFVYIVLSRCYCFAFSAEKSLWLFFSGLEIYTRKVTLRQSSVFRNSFFLDSWQQCVKTFFQRQWFGKGVAVYFLVLSCIKQEQYFIERFCTQILIPPLSIETSFLVLKKKGQNWGMEVSFLLSRKSFHMPGPGVLGTCPWVSFWYNAIKFHAWSSPQNIMV